MPDPAGTYNQDGILLMDSFTASVGGTTFIFESFDPDEGSATDVSLNEVGVPRAARDRKTLITGTATLQYPTGATTDTTTPLLFAPFTAPYRGVQKNWIITKVGEPRKAGAETKVSINFREKLNN